MTIEITANLKKLKDAGNPTFKERDIPHRNSVSNWVNVWDENGGKFSVKELWNYAKSGLSCIEALKSHLESF